MTFMNPSIPDSAEDALHVWNAAGKALFSGRVEGLSDVRTLKRQLQELCGVPRFRQRLLHGNVVLDDDAQLDSPVNLQLVLLPFCSTSYVQVIELHKAAETGDVSALEKLLQRPQNPELQLEEGSDWDSGDDGSELDDYRQVPLSTASFEGHVESVQLLLEARAHSDGCWETDITGTWTPLCCASSRGHVEIVRLLLKAAANPNGLRQQRASKPLCLAATAGEPSIVRMLLEADADKDAFDLDGETALCKASWEGHMEIARLLLSAGVDIDAYDGSDGCTAYPHGINSCKFRPPRVSGTPLCAASESGHEDVVRLLLSVHAYTEARNAEGETPLCAASLTGHLVIVQLLLGAFADIDVFNNNGETPLCAASFEGHIDVVAFLLKAGADRNAVDENASNIRLGVGAKKRFSHSKYWTGGMTPLCAASCTGSLCIVRLLLNAGANDAAPDSKGNTPYSLALRAGHLQICNFLKAWDEDAQCRNIKNKRHKRD